MMFRIPSEARYAFQRQVGFQVDGGLGFWPSISAGGEILNLFKECLLGGFKVKGRFGLQSEKRAAEVREASLGLNIKS